MDIFQNQGRKKLQPPDNLRWDFFSRLDSWESKNCFFLEVLTYKNMFLEVLIR